MTFYRRINRPVRDFTMVKACVLLALLAVVQVLGALPGDEGKVARDAMSEPLVIPALAQPADDSASKGRMI